MIKINIDVAVNIEADRVGLGMVSRSSDGTVVLAASKSVWPYYGVEHIEIEAFSWAVELGQTFGGQHCVFEGDTKVVVEALNGNVFRAGHNQVLIENILANSKGFEKVSFPFVFGKQIWLLIVILTNTSTKNQKKYILQNFQLTLILPNFSLENIALSPSTSIVRHQTWE